MPTADPMRRSFLKLAGGSAGAAWLAAQWPAVIGAALAADASREAAAAFSVLDPEEARDLAAIAAQIIPDNDTAGANETGVIYFVDAAFAGFMAGALPAMRAGLAALNARTGTGAQTRGRFAGLDNAAQQALLTAEQNSAFFSMLRFLTIAGYLALPAYGGNRGHAGWQAIGFDHRHAWQPPFGHYDENYSPVPADAKATNRGTERHGS